MNDERPIEKLLRRAAKKRDAEAGAPPELHPANRRLLQAEAAQQFTKPEAASKSAVAEFWAGLTGRWIYAIGIFLVLGLAAILILPTLSNSKSPTHLAQTAPSEDRVAMELAKNAPAPQSLGVPGVMLDADNARPSSLAKSRHEATMPGLAPTAPQAAAPPVNFSREMVSRRDSAAAPGAAPDTFAASGAIQPAARTESVAKPAVADEPGKTFDGLAGAIISPRSQPGRSVGAEVAGGVEKTASSAGPSGLTSGESHFAGSLATEQKELQSRQTFSVTKSAALPAETAAQDFADKSKIARGGLEGERAVMNSQTFSNVRAEPLLAIKKESPAFKDIVPVLAKFKIEQAGERLRVIDGDGSVYRGFVDEENTQYKQIVEQQNRRLTAAYENNLKFQSPKVAGRQAPATQQAGDYYLYRVEGTNRTLNQNVVFTWNFVPTNEAVAAAQITFKAAAQKLDATKLPSQFPELLRNSYIDGRAQFGSGREIEINAVPVKP